MTDVDADMAALAELSALGTEARDAAASAMETGELYSLSPSDAADLAAASVVDAPPEVSGAIASLVAADYASGSIGAFAASEAMSTRDMFAELRVRRRADMYRKASLTEEDATRIAFDEENGDLSPLNALRARYFFE